MKKIYIYKNSVIIVDPVGELQVHINGEEPIEIVDATPENIKKYFPIDDSDREALKTIKV